MLFSFLQEGGEKLCMGNFEELLTRSFPPCMRRLVEKQREGNKHLKHAGRLQLRPFLKACGFSFEESCQWWKKDLRVFFYIDVYASYAYIQVYIHLCFS